MSEEGTQGVLKLSDEAENKLRELAGIYLNKKSLVMPALYIAQEELGYISEDAISWVSKRLDISKAKVKEVATFYSMYHKKEVGKYHIQICKTLSCDLRGSQIIRDFIRERFSIKAGQMTEDKMWSLEEVECLGSCGTAPVLQINDTLFENQTSSSLKELFDKIELEKPDLSYSTIKEKMGEGIKGMPRSMILNNNKENKTGD